MQASLAPSTLFGDLPVLKLKYTLQIEGDGSLPDFLGSAWRGLVGWALKRLLCPYEKFKNCSEGCLLQPHCPYYLLFENKSQIPGVFDAPRGYIIYPQPGLKKGNCDVNITLFGDYSKFATVINKAIYQGQGAGIGKDRMPYKLVDAIEKTPVDTKPLSIHKNQPVHCKGPFPLKTWLEPTKNNGKLYFITPMRLKKKGHYQREMDWSFFLSTIVRRLESLNCLFNQGQLLGKEKWNNLSLFFEKNSSSSVDVKWIDLERFSNRQKRKIPMGGLVGEAFEQSANPIILEWLETASLIHAGKGASMGWGRIETA